MTTDIKQAVRELREATREHCPHQDRKGEHETYTHETAEWYCRACGFVADWTVESRVVELRGALISQQSIKRAFTGRDANRADSYMGGVAERHLPAVLDRLKELERIHGKVFKIMGGRAVPFEWIAPYESQAQRNHGQTLAQLDERGRLAPAEALCVVHGLSWRERKAQWKDDAVANADWETWCDNQASKRDAIRAKFAGLRKSISMAVDDSREHGSTGSVWSSHLEELLARFPALDSSETTDGREG